MADTTAMVSAPRSQTELPGRKRSGLAPFEARSGRSFLMPAGVAQKHDALRAGLLRVACLWQQAGAEQPAGPRVGGEREP